MSIAIVIGNSRCTDLFGDIFPHCGFVHADYMRCVDSAEQPVIFGEDINSGWSCKNALAAVVNADSDSFERIADKLCGIRMVSCGVSPRNAISVTSRTTTALTLSLNRSIKTVCGICEPLELPVELRSGFSEYDIMAAFAACLLLGKIG